MSMNMRCYDLQYLEADKKTVTSMMRHAAETGRRVPGYSWTYSNLHYGAFQLVTGGTGNPETKEPEMQTRHVHSAGTSLWQCRVVREITMPENGGLDMKLLVEPVSGGKGFTVLEVINPDILPSYAPGEIIELQMIAKAFTVRLYNDRDSFGRAEEQREIVPAGRPEAASPLREGYPMPLGFLCSGSPETEAAAKAAKAAGRENLVYLRGEILDRIRYSLKLPGEYNNGPVRNMNSFEIDTDFGPLEVIVSAIYGVEPWKGRTLSVLCTLQGDAMIGGHDYGMLIDPPHDLMALRYAFSSGRFRRLLPVMSEDCAVYAENGKQAAAGREKALKYLEGVYNKFRRKGAVRTLYGAADGMDGEVRLVAAGTDGGRERDSLLYVIPAFDEKGLIRSVRISGGTGRELRQYRSWLEMEEHELIRKGISPAILRKEKALSDFLNRKGRRDETSWVTGSMMDDNVVLEYGEARYEGIDRVMEFLEGVSRAGAAEAGFNVRPAYLSGLEGLNFQYRPDDTVQGAALLNKLDDALTGFFVLERNTATGRISRITGVPGEGYSHIIDYYSEWDTVPEKMKTEICRRE